MAHRAVREVMTADVVTVTLDTGFKELAGIMATRGISALPVLDAEGRVSSPRLTCCGRRSSRKTRTRGGHRAGAARRNDTGPWATRRGT
ncbi:MAG TPA: CBS domain-containing protein [Streptosporangiaceae bacterium]|nr:CBS domain-containing protein [Streptosporangiaceae bacterium]